MVMASHDSGGDRPAVPAAKADAAAEREVINCVNLPRFRWNNFVSREAALMMKRVSLAVSVWPLGAAGPRLLAHAEVRGTDERPTVAVAKIARRRHSGPHGRGRIRPRK
jgi:hypothetical protein